MPAQAGIQFYRRRHGFSWIPAGAGMTFGGFCFKLRHYPVYSVLDVKADCRDYKYGEETRQMLPEKPEPVL